MFLRSGLRYRSGDNRLPEQASQVSTEESVNQAKVEHLSTIYEEYVSDTSSEQTYTMEGGHPKNVNDNRDHVDTSKADEGRVRMKLQYLYTNPNGARIYIDSYNLHYVQEDLGKNEFQDLVEAYFRGDRYYDEQGIAYLRTAFPRTVDSMGFNGTKDKVDESIERPPLENDSKARFIAVKEMN